MGQSLPKIKHGPSLFSDRDIYLFREGSYFAAYNTLGSHLTSLAGQKGVFFAVWAPNAHSVSVVGNFNSWDTIAHPLAARWDRSGIWEGFIPGLKKGDIYKYHIVSKNSDYRVDKGDPFAYYWEQAPRTASIVWDLEYNWQDQQWLAQRKNKNSLNAPMSVYEVHLGAWARVPAQGNRWLTYQELADKLVKYVKEMGFTHVEFLPVMEHPFYGSWGYQTIGYFAPTSRYGSPQDFMFLIDTLHQQGIGVILDWVPSHFPADLHGPGFFDGTNLFEHADSRLGFHPDWKSLIFNYSRAEVVNFLVSSALFWLDKYHVDGLRLDAVASMLYLDYSRKPGEWIPNRFGGRENLAAVEFLKRLNTVVYERFPDVQTIAEESTAWSGVSRPVYLGGLGFGLKWNMGWMHDTLKYVAQDPIHRKYHQDELTFSLLYAFQENFMLPLSHDEVVHGKGSLFGKMPGDDWQKYANLRLLYSYMYGHPGKKLLFMGAEFAQWPEWLHDQSLDWHDLDYSVHQGVRELVKDLNQLHQTEPALYELDFEPSGFQWIDCRDYEKSVISFLRKSRDEQEMILVVCNFTPVPRFAYRLGVPRAGEWREVLNSDATYYGGSGLGNFGQALAEPCPMHGHSHSLVLTLPPLGALFFKPAAKL
ncbi:1,4-alpha-glucan branching enzyme [Candidatus Saganbacteria bacterium CG08_land_8_20_14_0_20_45_16]|uniref:1,4-alpha-glucan branching enzyme GlgB n=1 Tax=Candidatus Saganbacteria bacterium CG08_land_8_20_14_0_20_45_16 TaxID=2014293 RepID=A0A2H0Y1I1_UNCSA|nr:MAG: 1,4-alpha-glucan branching enzyme [Candidatus Saganbacteria bacterium CG08_land_8_20_14_0_20_45_16]